MKYILIIKKINIIDKLNKLKIVEGIIVSVIKYKKLLKIVEIL